MADEDDDGYLMHLPSLAIEAKLEVAQQDNHALLSESSCAAVGIEQGAWSMETDLQSGMTYYYNSDTQQSQWERPPDVSFAVQQADYQNYDGETAGKRNWRKLVDVTTGSDYYFDESTGEYQWEMPEDIDNDPTSYGDAKYDWQEIQSAAANATVVERPLRNGEIERNGKTPAGEFPEEHTEVYSRAYNINEDNIQDESQIMMEFYRSPEGSGRTDVCIDVDELKTAHRDTVVGDGASTKAFSFNLDTTQDSMAANNTKAAGMVQQHDEALQHLQVEMMLLRRQEMASVTLQARARGWAARRHLARQFRDRVVRLEKESEAKQIASRIIQATARGCMARREYQEQIKRAKGHIVLTELYENSEDGEDDGRKRDLLDPTGSDRTSASKGQSYHCPTSLSASEVRSEYSSQGSSDGNGSDVSSTISVDAKDKRRSATPSTLATEGKSQVSFGLGRFTNASRGKEMYRDTTVPGKKLEALRYLVARQAKTIARLAMTPAGTEAFRHGANKVRELAGRQEQAAANFLESIRWSLAIDSNGGSDTSSAYKTSSLRIRGRTVSLKPMPGGAEEARRSTPEALTLGMVENSAIYPESRHGNVRTGKQDEACDWWKRERNLSNEESHRDQGAHQTDLLDRDKVEVYFDRELSAEDEALADHSTVKAALMLTSEFVRLASRQGEVADKLTKRPQEAIEDSKGPDAFAALVPSVGLQAKAIGLLDEIVIRTIQSRIHIGLNILTDRGNARSLVGQLDARMTARAAWKEKIGRTAESLASKVKMLGDRHQRAASKLEVAQDPITVQHVADGIRHLILVHEQLMDQIQRFAESARTTGSYLADQEGGLESTIDLSRAEDQDGEAAVKNAQELITRLSAHVISELRKGVDIGDLTIALGQTGFSGVLASRFAEELRRAAKSQNNASMALAKAGAQLIVEASTEKPLPRDYTRPYQHIRACVAAAGSRTEHMVEVTQMAGNIETNVAFRSDANKGIDFAKARQVRHRHSTSDVCPSETEGIAIKTAAKKEEIAAAGRIQHFLRRRLRGRCTKAFQALTLNVNFHDAASDASSQLRREGTCPGGPGGGWLGGAIITLRKSIDLFLGDDSGSKPNRSHSISTASSSTQKHRSAQETHRKVTDKISDNATRISGRSSSNSGAGYIHLDANAEDIVNEANNSSWATFPSVPLRARAPSLYTLSAPLVSLEGHGGHCEGGGNSKHNATCSDKNKIDRAPEIVHGITKRLSSIRSVFSLRASDVLEVFVPPLTPSLSAARGLRSRTSTPLVTVGCDKPPRTPPPDALRHRLQAEAKDAVNAGVGRPWGSSWRIRPLVNHQPDLAFRAKKHHPQARDVKGDGVVGRRKGKMWGDTWGPATALGRRLLEKRLSALRNVQRQNILGETDARRVRHAGRRLRSKTAVNALDEVGRTLDLHDSRSREERVPTAHMEQLLDHVDRFAFSGSQLCDIREKAPIERRNDSSDGVPSHGRRCRLCQFSSPGSRRNEDEPPKESTNKSGRTGEVVHGHECTSTKTKTPIEGDLWGMSSIPRQEPVQERPYSAPVARIQDYPGGESAFTPKWNGLTNPREAARARSMVAAAGVIRRDNETRSSLPTRKPDTVAAEFSRHLQGVDKYPLELARLCRFAQFLTENNLFREAYEVILHAVSSSTVGASSTDNIRGNICRLQFPVSLPSGLGGQLLLIASRLAMAVGRYSAAVRHVKVAIHGVTANGIHDSSSLLMAASRVFEKLLDDRSAEVLLLGCLLQDPYHSPALSLYGRLAARNGEMDVAERYLKRAIWLSSDAVKGETARSEQQTSDWIALMNIIRDKKPSSTKSSSAVNNGHSHSATSASASSVPVRPYQAHPYAQTTKCLGEVTLASNHSEYWLLWALYAKFAEHCLKDPYLALYALERANEATSMLKTTGIGPKRSGGKALVARAQLYQRWPELVHVTGSGGNTTEHTEVEHMFVKITKRYPQDPMAHTALGYYLLSRDNGYITVDLLERALSAFRAAKSISGGDVFVPAIRGLAVVMRRLFLVYSAVQRPTSSAVRDKAQYQQAPAGYDCSPGDLLLRGLEAPGLQRKENVALLRTAAMHLYSWRQTVDPHGSLTPPVPTDSKVVMAAANRFLDEKRAEVLLTRALELEPFHVPTLAALAFMLLQRGAVVRAERMLELAMKCAERRVPRDVFRAIARIRASQGRRLSAISLFHRAAVINIDDKKSHNDGGGSLGKCHDDPISLCGLGRLLLTAYIRTARLPAKVPISGCATNSVIDGVVGHATTSGQTVKPSPPTKNVLMSPSDNDKAEAERLFARALAAAGGTVASETVLTGSSRALCSTNGSEETGKGGGWFCEEESEMSPTLAEVHFVVSGCSIKGARGGTGVGRRRVDLRTDGARRWHLQQAAKAHADTKVGLTARYILGQHALATGNDRKAEIELLGALDAEPSTYGACAAYLSVLRQVSVDSVKAKARLRRLRRRLKNNKEPHGASSVPKEAVAVRLSKEMEFAHRSVKLLDRLKVYASLRKRYMGERLRGAGLTNPEWALALEDGWETQYTRALEAGDDWAAMYCLN